MSNDKPGAVDWDPNWQQVFLKDNPLMEYHRQLIGWLLPQLPRPAQEPDIRRICREEIGKLELRPLKYGPNRTPSKAFVELEKLADRAEQMTDVEILAEAKAEGIDVEAEAERVRKLMLDGCAKARPAQEPDIRRICREELGKLELRPAVYGPHDARHPHGSNSFLEGSYADLTGTYADKRGTFAEQRAGDNRGATPLLCEVRYPLPRCTKPAAYRVPDPCWSSSTLVCEEHHAAFKHEGVPPAEAAEAQLAEVRLLVAGYAGTTTVEMVRACVESRGRLIAEANAAEAKAEMARRELLDGIEALGRAEAERDAMRPVVEACERIAEEFSFEKWPALYYPGSPISRIKVFVDAYRSTTAERGGI